MNTPEKTTRKGNPLLGISLSVLFTALGLYLFFNVAEKPDTANPGLVKTIGAACAIFFMGLLVLAIVKSLKK